MNDPDDLGGATNMGITLKTYRYYCQLKGYPTPTFHDFKNVSDERWNDVLKSLFWDKFKADLIENQNIADILVDWLWGSGGIAITNTQRLLDVTVDGIVGKETLHAINIREPHDLFFEIKGYRKKYLWDICEARPTNYKFLKGWQNRLNDLTFLKL